MEISVFKNNNKTLYFAFYKDEGPYFVPLGTQIKFTVKKYLEDSDENIVLSKTITGDGSSNYSVALTATDTNQPCGLYWWDLKDITTGVTISTPDRFNIRQVVLIND